MAKWMMPVEPDPESRQGLLELSPKADALYGPEDAWVSRDSFGDYHLGFFGAPLNGAKLNKERDNRPCVLRGRGPTVEAAYEAAKAYKK